MRRPSRFALFSMLLAGLFCSDSGELSAENVQKKNNHRRRNPAALAGSKSVVFKTIGDVKLKMHVFMPKGR